MVTRVRLLRGAAIVLIGYGAWDYFYEPKPTILSAHVGKTFEQVAHDSTYPVLERSGGDAPGMQWTDITEPSVIIRFSDPQHGFVLPPTTFAAITYEDGKVTTISTSPMLRPLPFDKAIAILTNLQAQFQAGGWQPWAPSESHWYDLSPQGRVRLHHALHDEGWYPGQELIVPGKYSMIFRIYCKSGCGKDTGLERYLIDVGLGHDYDAADKAWKSRTHATDARESAP